MKRSVPVVPGVNGEEERERARGAHTANEYGGYGQSRVAAEGGQARGTEPRKTKGTDTRCRWQEPQQQQVGSSREVNGNPMPSRQRNPRAPAGGLAFHERAHERLEQDSLTSRETTAGRSHGI